MRMLGAVALLSLLSGGMVACSGSGGTDVAGGGTGGTGAVAYGTVTDLGSIQVNGLWWETAGAEISLDGAAPVTGEALPGGGDGLLRRGMVVRIEGSGAIVNGKREATRISYENTLQGRVEGTPTQSQFTVFRQIILVDPTLTRFEGVNDTNGDGIDGGDLKADDMVEVSGYTTPDGTIQATYVEAKPYETELELRGTILGVAPDSHSRFDIGSLTVDAESIAWDASNLIGERVRVRGIAYTDRVLTAASVEVEDGRIHSEDVDEAHLEGFVTAMGSSWEAFVLNGQPVNALNAEFNGGDSASIAPGVRLKVRGMIRDGTLVAQEVSFADAIELAAPVAAVGPDTLTLAGLSSGGDGTSFEITVQQGVTEYEGDQVVALADIAVGDFVEVRARESGGALLATKISGQGPAEAVSPIALQGPVDASLLSGSVITLLGIEIDTSDPSLLISDEYGQPLSSQELIAVLKDNPNAVVEAKGTWAGSAAALVWESLELDD